MPRRPSKFRVLAFDEGSALAHIHQLAVAFAVIAPFTAYYLARHHWLWVLGLVVFAVVGYYSHFRSVVVGDDGMSVGRRLISYETLECVKISGRDVIVRVSIDSNLRLRTRSHDRAEYLHDALRQSFVAYGELVFDADDVASHETAYRKAASDVTWKVAFSPLQPISDRARAALHVLRDDVTSANALRLAEIAGASAHHAFATLVRSRVSGEALTARAKKRIARDLGLRASEL